MIGGSPLFNFASERTTRYGCMSFVVRLANLIEKVRETSLTETTFSDDWSSFLQGEIAESNENNAKNLGGRPRSTMDDEDEAN